MTYWREAATYWQSEVSVQGTAADGQATRWIWMRAVKRVMRQGRPPPLQTNAGLNNACRLSLKTLTACISIFSDNCGSGQLQAWLGCCSEIRGRPREWLAAFLNTTVAPMPKLMVSSPLEIVLQHWWRSDRGPVQQQISEWVSCKLFFFFVWLVEFVLFHSPKSHLAIIAGFYSIVLAACQHQINPLKCRTGTLRGREDVHKVPPLQAILPVLKRGFELPPLSFPVCPPTTVPWWTAATDCHVYSTTWCY